MRIVPYSCEPQARDTKEDVPTLNELPIMLDIPIARPRPKRIGGIALDHKDIVERNSRDVHDPALVISSLSQRLAGCVLKATYHFLSAVWEISGASVAIEFGNTNTV